MTRPISSEDLAQFRARATSAKLGLIDNYEQSQNQYQHQHDRQIVLNLDQFTEQQQPINLEILYIKKMNTQSSKEISRSIAMIENSKDKTTSDVKFSRNEDKIR